jgi:hypothetical protein
MAKVRSRDNTALDINKIIEERNKLIVSGTNPSRLKELQDKILYFYYGIKN